MKNEAASRLTVRGWRGMDGVFAFAGDQAHVLYGASSYDLLKVVFFFRDLRRLVLFKAARDGSPVRIVRKALLRLWEKQDSPPAQWAQSEDASLCWETDGRAPLCVHVSGGRLSISAALRRLVKQLMTNPANPHEMHRLAYLPVERMLMPYATPIAWDLMSMPDTLAYLHQFTMERARKQCASAWQAASNPSVWEHVLGGALVPKPCCYAWRARGYEMPLSIAPAHAQANFAVLLMLDCLNLVDKIEDCDACPHTLFVENPELLLPEDALATLADVLATHARLGHRLFVATQSSAVYKAMTQAGAHGIHLGK